MTLRTRKRRYTVKNKAIDPNALGLDVVHPMGEELLCHCYLDEHVDTKPSATFNVTNGLYYCFACQHGTNAKRIAKYLGTSVEWVPRNQIVIPNWHKPQDDWQWVLRRPLALDNEYLQSRGVDNGLVKLFGIREAVIGVAIILRDFSGRPIGTQIRKYGDAPNKYLILGERPYFWPIQHAQKSVYLVEGFFGVLRAAQYDVKAVTTLGAGVPQETWGVLGMLSPVAVFDDDFPGYVGAGKVVQHCNGQAVVPGMETDEVNWEEDILPKQPTRNLKQIAMLSGQTRKFYKLLKRGKYYATVA